MAFGFTKLGEARPPEAGPAYSVSSSTADFFLSALFQEADIS
jgi:hypothetical protein